MPHPLETYLRELADARAHGVRETSGYPILRNLLNEVGKDLKPRVECIIHPRKGETGIPDGALYTRDQFPRDAEPDIPTVAPARGVIEVKGTGEDIRRIAGSEQVARYLTQYGLVLVTNYRDFLVVERDPAGNAVAREGFSLADDEAAFWKAAAHARAVAASRGDSLLDFLRRAMLHNAPLSDPRDVAWFLASYAREALVRVSDAPTDALGPLREGLESFLGLTFEGEKGEHFFRSTLVQTLFYGLFAAWVLWSQEPHAPGETFDWRRATWSLHVPVVHLLYEHVSRPSMLGSLNLVEVLDWAAAALNRVEAAFFERFEKEHAVQYFYEPFLAAYDPALRKDLGVWYTPPEIVKYQVERVDAVLRSELGIPDGLADPRVVVLDPCCGTGAYLVEVLRRIRRTLEENGGDALMGEDLKRAARERVYGFEILPAPFVIAHMQLGLMLRNAGAPLSDSPTSPRDGGGERAGVFLTNALTGWDPPQDPKDRLPLFPQLEAERDAAEKVKREARILVVLGNPPYNAFAGVSRQEENGLVEPYKEGLIGEWGIKKFNLDDLYVRFFRLAERRIAESLHGPQRGVVCFISNHSWVSDPSFVVMRKHLLRNFDKFWIENMHGNRKISEYGPDGRTSETVFAMRGFSPGIQQGVAISLWAKTGQDEGEPEVLFRDSINASRADERRAQLLESLAAPDFDAAYEPARPDESNRYSFRPSDVSAQYQSWAGIDELCELRPTLGILDNRRDALVNIDRTRLEQRMRQYFDPSVEWGTVAAEGHGLSENAARFDAEQTRKKAIAAKERYQEEAIRRVSVRPMDMRWCYYSAFRPIWNEPRPSYFTQCWPGNFALVSRRKGVASPEGSPFDFISAVGMQHALSTDAYYFPLQIGEFQHHRAANTPPIANLSPAARKYLAALGFGDPDGDAETAGLVWMHALAIGYAPAYLSENADGVRQDWPRIPLPNSAEALRASAALGRRVAALLDTESPVSGVTAGHLMPGLRAIGNPARVGCGGLEAADLSLTAGWGRAGKAGVTMPGKGRAEERAFSREERDALGAEAAALLGGKTRDVYLNDAAYWKNVPERVWTYTIGGYQVLKKWLSYREAPLLGRALTVAEAREVRDMARRLAALVLMEPELDANYRAVAAAAWTLDGTGG